MNKFSDYIKNSESNNATFCSKKNSDSIKNAEKSKYDQTQLEEMIEKYSSFDNSSLMNEFIKLTLEKKKRGELTQGEINGLKSTLLPFLSAEQRVNLEKILDVVSNV